MLTNSESRILPFLKTGLRYIVRPANPWSAIRPTLAETAASTKAIATQARRAFSRERDDPEYAHLLEIADPHLRFFEALKARGFTWRDLPVIQRSAERRFTFFFVATVLALVYAIMAPALGMTGHSLIPAMDLALPYILCLPGIALTARASFALYQIRGRSLVGPEVWLRDPGGWLGGLPTRSAMIAITIGLAAAEGFLPGQAHAQSLPGLSTATSSAGWFANQLGAQDLSLAWLNKLFPAAASIWGGSRITGTATDGLAPIFALFNSLLLTIGAAALAWFTTMAIVETAHTGNSISNRWHLMWSPIRVCLGIASLAPVTSYCLAQLLVLQIAFCSYGIGNRIWTTYLDTMLASDSAAIVTPPATDLAHQVASQVLQSETCATLALRDKALEDQQRGAFVTAVQRLGIFTDTRPQAVLPAATGTAANGATTWDYGPLCGSLKLAATSSLQNGVGLTTIVPTDADQAAFQAFDQQRAQLLGRLVQAVRDSGLAEDITNAALPTGLNPDPGLIQGKLETVLDAAEQFNTGIISAAKTLANGLDKAGRARFRASAEQLGWASAGALNSTIVRLSAEVADHAAAAAPEWVPPNPARLGPTAKADLEHGLHDLNVLIADTSATDYVRNSDVQVREDHQSWDPFAIIFKGPMDRLARGLTNAFAMDQVNPMSGIMALGNASLYAGEGMIAGYVAASGAAATAKEGTTSPIGLTSALPAGIAAALAAAGSWINIVAGGLIVVGAVHAYVLPMLFYVLWFFAVLGCVSLLVELVVAAPMAAFMHVRFDGDSLVDQQQRPFYVLLLVTLMRPALLLLSLFLANLVFSTMASFLNQTFGLAMIVSQGNNLIGVVGVLTMLLLMMYLHYQLTVRCMSLVHQIPAMVGQMIGAPDVARGEEEHTRAVNTAVGGMISRGGQTAASKALAPNVSGGEGAGNPGKGGPQITAESVVKWNQGGKEVTMPGISKVGAPPAAKDD